MKASAARNKRRPVNAARKRTAAKKAARRTPAKTVPAKRRAPARQRASAKNAARTTKTTTARRPAPRAAARPQPRVAARAPLKWTDTLSDGTHVIVRPIAAKDAHVEREFIERLSPESRRLRFLGQISVPSDDMVRRFVDIDYDRDMAFVALLHRDNTTQEIGVSRYSRSNDGKSCECAVTVSDEWRNRGLATLLMKHLIDFARSRGIRTMVSYDAVENGDMRALADGLGFTRRTDPGDAHMVIHSLKL